MGNTSQSNTITKEENMPDNRKVGKYFEERDKVKAIMKQMLKPKKKWTRKLKADFEKAWKDYCKAYDEHERLC